jgi:uncharacterized protein (DUF58 family)
MPIRRRAWFSREGWYYSAVLAFILAGAVLKSVNLLVVLAGMMIAPLLINWRMVMAGLQGLTVRRRLPEQVCAGETLTVEVVVRNPRRWMSSWMVTVEDWIERIENPMDSDRAASKAAQRIDRPANRRDRWSLATVIHWTRNMPWWGRLRHSAGRGQAVLAHVPAGGQAIGTYRATLHRRGRYRFGPLRVSTRFPLGLVWGHFTLPNLAELIVSPRIGRLSPEWAALIEAELVGDQRRHPQRGNAEGDYYGLRAWQSGDSMRWVHWRSTAKMGRPMVRQFERRRNQEVAIILDPWLPERPLESDEGLMELAISLAATAVADLTSRGHSRLTFAVASSQPECWTGPASPLFCRELLGRLADVQPVNGFFLAETLPRVTAEALPGARMVVISPRGADSRGAAGSEVELGCDPDLFYWIDVSGSQLPSMFSLDQDP